MSSGCSYLFLASWNTDAFRRSHRYKRCQHSQPQKNQRVTKELTEILLTIREKVTDESDLTWTRFDIPYELRNEIDRLILRLQANDESVVKEIHFHFLPTSTFQEHAIQNGWSDEYTKLADQFDTIYKTRK